MVVFSWLNLWLGRFGYTTHAPQKIGGLFFMKKLIILILILSIKVTYSQSSQELFIQKIHTINRTGMSILGTWSVGNLTYSSIKLTEATGSNKTFHQMNLGWSSVNLSLATLGFIQSNTKRIQPNQSIEFLQTRTEKIFLINTILDIGYMSAGLIMMQSKNPENQEIMHGFGSSILLQGGFLFVFDSLMYLTHKQHKKHNIVIFPIANNEIYEFKTMLKINQ